MPIIARYFQILSCIGKYCSSDYSAHSYQSYNIVRDIQILSNIVKSINERKLVLGPAHVKVKVKVKVQMKKFQNCFLLPELIDGL